MNTSPADLIDEMDEYARLGVGGSLLQICDENGQRSTVLSAWPTTSSVAN